MQLSHGDVRHRSPLVPNGDDALLFKQRTLMHLRTAPFSQVTRPDPNHRSSTARAPGPKMADGGSPRVPGCLRAGYFFRDHGYGRRPAYLDHGKFCRQDVRY